MTRRILITFDQNQGRTVVGYDRREAPRLVWDFVRLWWAGRHPRAVHLGES